MSDKITREKMVELTVEDARKQYEADLVAFQEVVDGTKTVDELKALEAELMKDFDANDEYIKTVTYDLPSKVDYDGSTFKAGDIRTMIIGFINRLEVPFQATLGIHQAIRFWKTMQDNVAPYAVYDSTLRLLGQLKFKGERDCLEILVINNWFSAAHNAYSHDVMYHEYLSMKHQAIVKAMEQLEKAAEPVNE